MENILKNCQLFSGIERDDLLSLLKCLNAKKCIYKKDEYIFHAGHPALSVGIVLKGGVNIVQDDIWGNRTILTHAEPGDLFGEAFSCAEINSFPVGVVASEQSEILLVDYRKIITICSSACIFHSKLISNMLRIIANKNIMLTQKLEHISKRTIREKLLSFLSEHSASVNSRIITIPFNRQELADYLCVERSALSREISLMKRDGLLDYNKNKFTLLKLY